MKKKTKKPERNVNVQSEGILQLSSLEPADSHCAPAYTKLSCCCLSFSPVHYLFFFYFFFCLLQWFLCYAVSETAPQIAEDEQIGLVVRKICCKTGGGNFFSWLSQKKCHITVPRGYHYITVMWISTYCSQWGIHIFWLRWLLYKLALVAQVTFDYFGYFLSSHNVDKLSMQLLQSKTEIEKQCIIPNYCSCHIGKGTFLNLWKCCWGRRAPILVNALSNS